MASLKFLTVVACTAVLATSAFAQQTQRVKGTVDKVDGNTLYVKGPDGAPIRRTDDARARQLGEDALLDPEAIAASYLHVHRQHRSAWTWEVELRPWAEKF